MMKVINQLISNDERKSLFSNFLSLSALQVIGYIFPLITIPYLARIIGVKGFGCIAFAASVVAYFQTITDWGFKFTAVRDIAKNRNDISTVSTIFSNVIITKLILSIVSAIILFALCRFVPILKENQNIIWVTFLLIPGYVLFTDWFYQAMEDMKYITIMNFISKGIFTILVFFVIKKPEDYVIEPLLTACGYFISGLIAFIYAIKHFKLKFVFPSISQCVQMILLGKDMFISQFLPTLYNNLSIIMLGSFCGTTATGLFSSGYKFISISDQFSNVLSRTFFPFLARRMEKHGVFVRISGLISILMGVFLFIFADLIVSVFYTKNFADSANVIRIMSLSPFFLFLMNAYGTNGLVLVGKENILRNIILWCSLFGFIMAFISIQLYGYIGVALTLVTVWGIRGVVTWYCSRKYLSSSKNE